MTHSGTQIYSLYEREPRVESVRIAHLTYSSSQRHKPPIKFETKFDVKNEYQNEFLIFLTLLCYIQFVFMSEGFLNEPRFNFVFFFIARPYITVLLNVMYAVRELHILSTNKSILGRRNRFFINKNAGSSTVLLPE